LEEEWNVSRGELPSWEFVSGEDGLFSLNSEWSGGFVEWEKGGLFSAEEG